MSGFDVTFPLNPTNFPYTKQVIQAKRNARTLLGGELFFDQVLRDVARVEVDPGKLYPPRTLSDLRALHEAVERSPVDLLKKQCCLYYVLRDWEDVKTRDNNDTDDDDDDENEDRDDRHGYAAGYAATQGVPENYRALMDGYWALDNARYAEALARLTTPGLTPNFTTKIMATFAKAGEGARMVRFVQTVQPALDTEEKVDLYLDALVRVDVARTILFTRTTTTTAATTTAREGGDDLRRRLFERVMAYAAETGERASVLARFPYDAAEETWAHEFLSRTPGPGLEALILRLTMMGDLVTVIRLRNRHGGGREDLNGALRASLPDVELKLAQQA